MIGMIKKRGLTVVITLAMVVVGCACCIPSDASAETVQIDVVGNTTQTYDNIQNALDSTVGSLVILKTDVDASASKVTISKDVTLDLNGHKLKTNNNVDQGIYINANASLRVIDSSDGAKDGTGKGAIYVDKPWATGTNGSNMIQVEGKFVLESGLIYSVIEDDAKNKGHFGVGVFGNGQVTINGGRIESGWYAISGNGNDTGSMKVIINGGVLISTADYALYNPCENAKYIINGGVVSGAAGAVAIRAGELEINGGQVSSKNLGDTGNWNDGTGGLGNSAIAIESNYGQVSVKINNGTITSDVPDIFIIKETYSYELAIKGGSFSSDVSKYLAADYDQMLINGFYTVFLHKETTDDSGTTTTEIVYPDGTKETEVKDASGTVTKETERPDGTKETEVTDATGASQKTTTSTEVVDEVKISITTVVEKDSDGNVVSAESKAGFTADSDGNVSTAVVEATITAMESSGESDLSKTISIESETEEITFEEAAVTAISSSGAVLEFTNKAGTLTADQGVISTLADQSYSLTLSFSETENDTLSKAQQKVVGDSTAYSLALIRSDGVTIHNLNGTVTVSVEYTPSEGTSLSDIQVIYVDDNGKMEAIDTEYDSGILTFHTEHFSCFMIGTSSMLPSDPVIVPSYDDDDYYPVVPVTPASTSSDDDDTKTIVACAAAAVAAALAVAFFLVDSRRP